MYNWEKEQNAMELGVSCRDLVDDWAEKLGNAQRNLPNNKPTSYNTAKPLRITAKQLQNAEKMGLI